MIEIGKPYWVIAFKRPPGDETPFEMTATIYPTKAAAEAAAKAHRASFAPYDFEVIGVAQGIVNFKVAQDTFEPLPPITSQKES